MTIFTSKYKSASMESLPQELIDELRSYLAYIDLLSLRAVSRRLRVALCDLQLTFNTIKVIIHPTSLRKLYDLTKHRRLASEVHTLIIGTENLDQYVSQRPKAKIVQETLRQFYKGGSVVNGARKETDLEQLRQNDANLLLYCAKRLPSLKALQIEDPPRTRDRVFENFLVNEDRPRRFAASSEMSRSLGLDIYWNGPYPIPAAHFKEYSSQGPEFYYADSWEGIGNNLPCAGRTHSLAVGCKVIHELKRTNPSLQVHVILRARMIYNNQTGDHSPFLHVPRTWDPAVIWKNTTSMSIECYQFPRATGFSKSLLDPFAEANKSSLVHLHLSEFCRGRHEAGTWSGWNDDRFDYSSLRKRRFPHLRSMSLTNSFVPCHSMSFRSMLLDIGRGLRTLRLENLRICQPHGHQNIWHHIALMEKLKTLHIGKLFVGPLRNTLYLFEGEMLENVEMGETEWSNRDNIMKGVHALREGIESQSALRLAFWKTDNYYYEVDLLKADEFTQGGI